MKNEIYFAVKGGKKHIIVNKPSTVCLIYKTLKIYDYVCFESKDELTEYLKIYDRVVKLKDNNFDLWFNKLEAGYYHDEMQRELLEEMKRDNTYSYSDRYSMCMCDEVECLCFFDTFIHGRR